jgi:hypothetical protein
MTPAMMAKAECPNNNNGECDGMVIHGDLRQTQGEERKQCLLMDRKRCGNFEKCIAPLAEMVEDPAKSKAYIAAVADYRFTHHIKGMSRKCPDCGEPIGKRRRICPNCALKRRKKTYRDAQSRKRG